MFLNSNMSLIPVILGSDINGLGLSRSFGQEKINSIVLDFKKNIAFFSKFTQGIKCPHPSLEEDSFIKFLSDFGRRLPKKGLLFASDDMWLISICKYKSVLEPYFVFSMSDWNIIESCIDKFKLYKLALDNDVLCSKTFLLDKIADITNIKEEIVYPSILKPTVTVGFADALGIQRNTIVVNTKDELQIWENRIKETQWANSQLIIQEFIPGNTEDLVTCTSYSNKKSEIMAYSTGHKIRQVPPDGGTIISGRVTPIPEVVELSKKIIKLTQFYGISNIEFKRDSRDGLYKFIEINARPGKWNSSVLASGINLPYILYRDLSGDLNESNISSADELVWLDSIADCFHSLFLYKRKGFDEFSLNVFQWLSSIKGKKIDAIFSLSDFKPGLFRLYHYLILVCKKFRRILYD